MPEAQFDLAVVGAGINGAGIARDAAMRGLSVVVFDQGDLGSATSAWSSRLIHGGLRYLEYGEIPLVYESLRERRTLLAIAPHLVRPLPITIPVYAGAKRGPLLVRLGMLAYDLLSAGKSLPRHEMLDRAALEARVPGLRSDQLRGGACYYDAQVTYVERLVLENLLAARAAGASVCTWHEVEDLTVRDGRIERLVWRNRQTGASGDCSAHIVVNAAGPWVDRVLARTRAAAPRLIGGTKGSHVVVNRFGGAPNGAFYVEAEADGRPVFIIPWNGQILIGTTDLRYDGDPAAASASCAEADYLLAEVNRVFPGALLTREDVRYAYAGVRPLPYRSHGPESAITRRHLITRDSTIARNLVSIVGGKLTTYRNLAEQAVDLVGRLLRRRLPECRTADTPLPGGHDLDLVRAALVERRVADEAGMERLLRIYGARARRLIELVAESDGPAAGNPLFAAEVALAFREEFAVTLVDVVFRRTMRGLDADQGRPDYGVAASLAQAECGWDDARRERELGALVAYADSLRRLAPAGDQSAPPR
jgi:glycerol-3-phosphate dehydrogenase